MPYLLGLVLVSFILTSVFMVPFIDLLFFLKRKFQRQTINKNESQTPIHDVLMKADEKTPSGSIHIGSGRGWVIHDAIAKALRDKGVKARFILSSDDMDPLDKPSKELSKEEIETVGNTTLEKEEVLNYIEAKGKRTKASYSTQKFFDANEAEILRAKAINFVNRVKTIIDSSKK